MTLELQKQVADLKQLNKQLSHRLANREKVLSKYQEINSYEWELVERVAKVCTSMSEAHRLSIQHNMEEFYQHREANETSVHNTKS